MKMTYLAHVQKRSEARNNAFLPQIYQASPEYGNEAVDKDQYKHFPLHRM